MNYYPLIMRLRALVSLVYMKTGEMKAKVGCVHFGGLLLRRSCPWKIYKIYFIWGGGRYMCDTEIE